MSNDSLCECCNKPNMWSLFDEEYTYVCGVCVEAGLVVMCEDTGHWRITAECRCGKTGPVNYTDGQYFCGGSDRCIP